jgi:hypothetical protein
VQAKWDHSFGSRIDMDAQLRSMLSRTNAAHVWIYHQSGVISVPATDVLKGEMDNAQTAGQLIADGVRCSEGDPRIGRDIRKELVRSLNEMLREVAADTALGVTVRSRKKRRRRR